MEGESIRAHKSVCFGPVPDQVHCHNRFAPLMQFDTPDDINSKVKIGLSFKQFISSNLRSKLVSIANHRKNVHTNSYTKRLIHKILVT